MESCILDASVGAKWLFPEELSEKALALLERSASHQIRIIVPEFFYVELANICWVKVKRKLATIDSTIKGLDYVISLPFVRYSDLELADVALENSLRFNISAYDGFYLALAEIYVAPLVTADDTLLKACRGRFDFIEPLSEVHF